MDWDLTDTALHAATESGRGAGVQRRPSQGGQQSATNNRNDPERNRQIALHNANLLQQRKAMEKSVLDSTIKLIDYPTSKDADPDKPSKEDARAVKQHLRLFQPPDYDTLITERNIEKQCGYVLCPRPHKPIGRVGKWTILQQGHNLEVVETNDVMRWCSDDCARRAMYLRVQISEKPPWERSGNTQFELSGEDPLADPNDDGKIDREAVAKVAEDLKQLALERGNPTADTDSLMTDVKEKSFPHR